jgi:hypothetical protein
MTLLGSALDGAVKLASAVRGERVIHAKGYAYAATVSGITGAAALDVPLTRALAAPRPAVVRFSRGAGLPDVLPDVLGLAIRVPDVDGRGGAQDLMLSTGARGRWSRRLLVPSRSYATATYTSLISYDVGARSLVLAALPVSEGDGSARLDGLTGAAFELATAEGGGEWQPFARLEVGEVLPAERGRRLQFEVTHDAGGFAIGGRWRAARAGAYSAARSVESEAGSGR